jgi:hypothetical protein
MKPETFAIWQQRQGHRVVQTASSYWIEAGPHIFQAFPYQEVINPSEAEFHSLFFEHGAIGVRFSDTLDASQGAISYHVVFTEATYPLDSLPKKARHDVQKGLRSAVIEPISASRLADEGWKLRSDTLERQGRNEAETQADWQRLCCSAEGLPGFEAWAAIIDGQLAAALLAFTCNDCCYILYQQSRTQFLSLGVNNALTFVFTNQVLMRPEKPSLFYGLHSLDAPSSVDEFKFRMGYIARAVRQRVVFHPWLRPLFNSGSHAVLKAGLRLRPGNPMLSKAEGMLRVYLQGRLPLSKQIWPPPLVT